MQNEIWKDVVGFEGLYEVSNTGLVKTLSFKRSGIPQIMKPGKHTENYFKVSLRKDKKTHYFFVHRLVLAAFQKQSNLFIDHINGDRTDNRIENLRYCTNRENMSFPNVKRRCVKSSKYTGVAWDKNAQKWKSSITIKRRSIHLGNYANEELAYEAYSNYLNSLPNDLR